MKSYPNASILTFITQTAGANEKLLFIYLKPVPDIYLFDKVHWYDGAGKDGKAKNVWESLSIKQWTACGKDADIIQLFDSIVSTKKLTVEEKEIILTISPYTPITHDAVPFKSRGDTVFDSLVTEYNALIPQEFYQKENLKFLSGYKSGSVEIKPISPLGFFEDNFIYDNLKKDTWGIKEYRTAYLTFHGVRKTSEKRIGSKEMVGFYQQKFNPASDYLAVVKNVSQKEIGKSAIDKETGFFKINLSEPTQKGTVEILINNKEEKAIEYVLLQDIQIDAQIANATFKDTYGRNYMITSNSRIRPETISNFTWQRSVFSDTNEADKKLSDLFKSIFDYLGPKVLIADPYFIGNFKQDKTTKAISPSPCQTALINALIHSAIEKGIDQINILGYWARAKSQVENDGAAEIDKIDQLFKIYEKVFKNFIARNQLKYYFRKGSIRFLNAKQEFHNRYWFSLTEKDGNEILDKCIVITNSVGNINELDIMPIVHSEEMQLKQIRMALTRLYNNADVKLKI